MPRKKFSDKRRATLTDGQVAFLLTGVGVRGDTDVYLWKIDDEKVKAAWSAVGPDLVPEHVKKFPGSRPWGWWVHDAPEMRLRVGGVGTERHVAFPGQVPQYAFGISTRWIDDRDVSFSLRKFNRIIGKAFDENDPPRHESQAAYLDRLGLLSAAERKRLPADAFSPEVITP